MSTQSTLFPRERRRCEMSPCGLYRYDLDIVWDEQRPQLGVVGLNPSTADHERDDHTVRKWKGFARRLGFGGLLVGNAFALRATDPRVMKAHPAPVGPDNDAALTCLAAVADQLVVCWGIHGNHMGRDRAVLALLRAVDPPGGIWCWGRTGKGQPRHPLMLPYSTPLERL